MYLLCSLIEQVFMNKKQRVDGERSCDIGIFEFLQECVHHLLQMPNYKRVDNEVDFFIQVASF